LSVAKFARIPVATRDNGLTRANDLTFCEASYTTIHHSPEVSQSAEGASVAIR
jgi:hypothetical protein